jgi:toxin ParE1/3/4
MSFQLFLTPLAQQDLFGLAEYLAEEALELSDRFLIAIQSTFAQISQTPRIGSPQQYRNPRLAGTRMWPVKGFENYLIFYHIIEEKIEVIRILHGGPRYRWYLSRMIIS